LGFPAGVIHDGVDRRYYFPPQSRELEPAEGCDRAVCRIVPAVQAHGTWRCGKRNGWPQWNSGLLDAAKRKKRAGGWRPSWAARMFHFLGHVGQAELGDEMRSADIFLFPAN